MTPLAIMLWWQSVYTCRVAADTTADIRARFGTFTELAGVVANVDINTILGLLVQVIIVSDLARTENGTKLFTDLSRYPFVGVDAPAIFVA